MDIFNSDSLNGSDLNKMGNILSTSNENEPENTNIKEENVTLPLESTGLTNTNIEVNEPDDSKTSNQTDAEIISQDLNLIIPDKSPNSSSEILDSFVKSGEIEESDELWLGDTRQLVKISSDEDFEVIVKSLETAIVETEKYDEIESKPEPATSAEFLLKDISQDLVPSPTANERDQENKENLENDISTTDSSEVSTNQQEIIELTAEEVDSTISEVKDQVNVIDSQISELNKEEKFEECKNSVEFLENLEKIESVVGNEEKFEVVEKFEGIANISLTSDIEKIDLNLGELTDENNRNSNLEVSVDVVSSTVVSITEEINLQVKENEDILTENKSLKRPNSDKEQSPSKKVKLIREKTQIPIVQVQEDKKIEELPVVEEIKIEQEDLTEKSTNEEIKNASPVKIQKLKLKRNYEPPDLPKNLEIFENLPEERLKEKIESTNKTSDEEFVEQVEIKNKIDENLIQSEVIEGELDKLEEENIDIKKLESKTEDSNEILPNVEFEVTNDQKITENIKQNLEETLVQIDIQTENNKQEKAEEINSNKEITNLQTETLSNIGFETSNKENKLEETLEYIELQTEISKNEIVEEINSNKEIENLQTEILPNIEFYTSNKEENLEETLLQTNLTEIQKEEQIEEAELLGEIENFQAETLPSNDFDANNKEETLTEINLQTEINKEEKAKEIELLEEIENLQTETSPNIEFDVINEKQYKENKTEDFQAETINIVENLPNIEFESINKEENFEESTIIQIEEIREQNEIEVNETLLAIENLQKDSINIFDNLTNLEENLDENKILSTDLSNFELDAIREEENKNQIGNENLESENFSIVENTVKEELNFEENKIQIELENLEAVENIPKFEFDDVNRKENRSLLQTEVEENPQTESQNVENLPDIELKENNDDEPSKEGNVIEFLHLGCETSKLEEKQSILEAAIEDVPITTNEENLLKEDLLITENDSSNLEQKLLEAAIKEIQTDITDVEDLNKTILQEETLNVEPKEEKNDTEIYETLKINLEDNEEILETNNSKENLEESSETINLETDNFKENLEKNSEKINLETDNFKKNLETNSVQKSLEDNCSENILEEGNMQENLEGRNSKELVERYNQEEDIRMVEEQKELKEEDKSQNLLIIDSQYPLLSSRLQEPKLKKTETKFQPVKLPLISEETVSKKLQEQFHEMKDATEINRLEKSELMDHSATMESATKIKITKRRPDSEASRSIIGPLSVVVDDLENQSTILEKPHSYGTLEQENVPKLVIKPLQKSEERSSPKITIKPIKPPEEATKRESSHSPKITIKPIKPDPLKITITKQKTDDSHSILKIYQPEDSHVQLTEQHVPKLTIKPISKSEEMLHSPRITIKPIKPSSSTISPKSAKPSLNEQVEILHSPKITVKPILEESYPKVTIKPILRPEDKVSQLSPRQIKLKSIFESSSGVTVEPVCPPQSESENQCNQIKISVKAFAKMDEALSPKLTIKPITKTCEIVQSEDGTSNPLKLTIKPILKSEDLYQSPKITIKPIIKPDEEEIVDEPEKPERIILKIQKTNLPSPKERTSTLKESKREPEIKIEAIPHDADKKLDKIKLKLTKEGSHAQIIPTISSLSDGSFSLKRSLTINESVIEKRPRTDFPGTEILHNPDISINLVEANVKPNPKTITEEVTIVKIDKSINKISGTEQQISQSKFNEMLLKIQQKPDISCNIHDDSSSSDDVKIIGVIENQPQNDPLSLQDDSEDVMIVNEMTLNPFQNVQIINAQSLVESPIQLPKKRGRPRKNPLEVKPEIKGEDCIEVRPKRTCRAPPGRTPFMVKERKPRGAGRGRGGSRGRGAKSPQKTPKEIKLPRAKALKEAKALAKIEAARLQKEVVIDEITIEDSTNDTPNATPEYSPKKSDVKDGETGQMVEPRRRITEELLKQPHPPPAVYEEETRMSADNSSRAQTPARQVFIVPLTEGPEESQSSVQSSATTESSKTKKGRLEVCDHDSAVTAADQIAEYSWGGGGPYMLQEQIAQFLGVKSFKRKYPGLSRRPVDMQERDYIREKGLVSESMCDMGLTAVPSTEILDIMYTDFQEKYEEYRKFQRDKQSKEISNKQRAISLATTQEKSKIDFKERAVRSAATWNLNFNKARKESRRCCMDLQTFTINFPMGKTKVPHKNSVGHYPIALVPGQYTDFFKGYSSNELNYLPLNTVRYGPVLPNQFCDATQSDGSQSDSDSTSGSDSDSSDDSITTEEEATTSLSKTTMQLPHLITTTPKSKVH